MEFLIQIQVNIPTSMSADELSALTDAERARGKQLQSAGTIHRIWRVPGTRNNVGIWRAADATELHAEIASLPLFKYMHIQVTPLAVHPLES